MSDDDLITKHPLTVGCYCRLCMYREEVNFMRVELAKKQAKLKRCLAALDKSQRATGTELLRIIEC